MWEMDSADTMHLDGQQGMICGTYDYCARELRPIRAALTADRYKTTIFLSKAYWATFRGVVSRDLHCSQFISRASPRYYAPQNKVQSGLRQLLQSRLPPCPRRQRLPRALLAYSYYSPSSD